jgi:GPH family glycoside/pentoside/hexuronide:cation symporter
MLGLFLLYFLTEVVGLPPALAGGLIFIGLLWDGPTDIAMGVIADRTRTRWGRFRPYLLIGAPLVGASLVLVFWAPPLSGPLLIAFVLAAQLVFRLAFTIVAIPYGALSSAMTQDSRERGVLTGFRVTGSTLAALTVALAIPALIGGLGQGDPARGYAWTAAIIGAAASVAIMICFFAAREVRQSAGEGRPPPT